MKASASTEVYRPLSTPLSPPPLRFLALWRAHLRVAFKRKLPLVLLLAPPAIAAVIFSFAVYTRFALEAGTTPAALGGGAEGGATAALGAAMIAGVAEQMIQVREMIVALYLGTSAFSVVLIAWFGAGLFAEDRRLGAHLLYFARPLSKLDYALAKFLTVATFGAFGALAPALVVCLVATFASPDWSFLKDEGELIPRSIGLACVWITLLSSIVLAASSLAPRKTFALAGTFGFLMLTGALSQVLAALQRDRTFLALSPVAACTRLATWMFELKRNARHLDVGWAWASVIVAIVASWIVIAARLRRLEAVG